MKVEGPRRFATGLGTDHAASPPLPLAEGSLADRLGRRHVFNIGFVVFLLPSLNCLLANDAVVLSVAWGSGPGGSALFGVGPALTDGLTR